MADSKKAGAVTLEVAAPEPVITTTDAETGKSKTLKGAEARKALDATLDAPPTPEPLRSLAERLPEKDDVQKATKAAMLASDPGEEVKEKVKAVEASPDAADTPSGAAMIAVQNIASHTERGEVYAQVKAAYRHGVVPVNVEKS